jgi:hypothetical protein
MGMKAKLIKVLDQYHLYDGDKAIATTIVGNPMLLPNLSKQNCDEIFGVVDVRKLADVDFISEIDEGPTTNTDINSMIRKSYLNGAEFGFIKAMELYQPTEIEVEVEMECLDPTCDGINRKGICIPGDKPKLDSEGCLILKKI